MAEEKKRFVLYEYLMYFWKRKWFFVIIPLIVTILVASAVYVLKSHNKYTGTGLVYTGSVKSPDLTNDSTIKGRYAEKYPDLADVFVTEKGTVKFTVKGNSKEKVQQDLNDITTNFNSLLIENARNVIDVSTVHMNLLNKRAETLDAALKVYRKKLEKGGLDIERASEISDIIIVSEDKRVESAERAYKMNGDIRLYEQPKVISTVVGQAKTYLKESIAIGIILGLILTVALLMLMKYLFDAQKYYRDQQEV